MGCEFKSSTDRKFSCPSTFSQPVHSAHVDYLLMVSPGKLTHSQAKVNKLRRNSHMKEENLRLLQASFGKDEHGFRERDIDHKDKQNF